MVLNRVSMCVSILALALCTARTRAEENEHEPGLVGEYFLGDGKDFLKVAPGQKPVYVRIDKNVAFGNTVLLALLSQKGFPS